ncbi:MAG TPA: PIN domain-containing protein [Candidatus Acidoferrum sp.]|nr:PIN domain-containing protein [Candidatus Acidoferrum sp.]
MILVDAGPLVALVDADDQYHKKCVAALKVLREPLATVWPPVTEAMYLLSDLPKAQEALWEMLARGVLQLLSLDLADVPRMRELMSKYVDRPMDLADAALVRVAEREGIRKIFTLDREDFGVYRLHGRVRPTVIP